MFYWNLFLVVYFSLLIWLFYLYGNYRHYCYVCHTSSFFSLRTEIYHNTQQNNLELQQGRPIFLGVNIIMYFILLALIGANYIFFEPQSSDDLSPIPEPLTWPEKIMQGYTGVLYLLIALGTVFLVFISVCLFFCPAFFFV
jgi:hypothetical protein